MVNSTPTNKKLYEKVKSEAKKKFKVWPSAYASSWLVRTYKSRGGKYSFNNVSRKSRYTKKSSPKRSRNTKKVSSRKSRKVKKSSPKRSRNNKLSGLKRWHSEKWIDVCKLPKIVPCGRKKSSSKNYPYCRPLKRINSGSPKTAREISRSELKRRCSIKRKSPYKRMKKA